MHVRVPLVQIRILTDWVKALGCEICLSDGGLEPVSACRDRGSGCPTGQVLGAFVLSPRLESL